MEEANRWLKMQPEIVTLLLGFGVGFGLAVHQIFFVVPLVIVLVLVTEWIARKAWPHLRPG